MLYLFNLAAFLKTFTSVTDENDHLNKEISQPQIAHSNDKIGKLSLFSVLIYVFSYSFLGFLNFVVPNLFLSLYRITN